MGALDYDRHAVIETIEYRAIHREATGGSRQSVLYIDFGDNYIHVNNTGFTTSNWSLMLLAYLGVRPSTMEDAIGKSLPVSETADATFEAFPPDWVFDQGRTRLEEAAWGPQVSTS